MVTLQAMASHAPVDAAAIGVVMNSARSTDVLKVCYSRSGLLLLSIVLIMTKDNQTLDSLTEGTPAVTGADVAESL